MESCSSLLSQLNKEYLTCAVCMDIYAQPKVLACQHTFCKTCLEHCERSEQGVNVICPVCREKTLLGFRGVQGLKSNVVLSNMIDLLEDNWMRSRDVTKPDDAHGDEQVDKMCQCCPETEVTMATYQCLDCLEHLCADCAAFHCRTKLTKSHQVASLQEIESGKHRKKLRYEEMSRCQKHNLARLDHHCRECDVMVCRDCVIEDHQGHRLDKVEVTVQAVKQEITELQEKIDAEVSRSNDVIKELAERQGAEEKTREQLKSDVNNAAEYFINRIKEKRNGFLKEIDDSFGPKLRNIEVSEKQVRHLVADYDNLSKISHHVTQDNIPSEMLALKNTMSKHLLEAKEKMSKLQTKRREQESGYDLIRFVCGEITEDTLKSMGYIKTERPTTERDVTDSDDSEVTSQADDEQEKAVQGSTSQEAANTKPDMEESLYANFTGKQEVGVGPVVKAIPVIPPKPQELRLPIPTPRIKSESGAAPVTLPRPLKKPKPTVSVKPNVSQIQECSKLTRIKGTVPVPPLKQAEPETTPTTAVKPLPQRAAPSPPVASCSPVRSPVKPPRVGVTEHRRCKSDDQFLKVLPKTPAPPPPIKLTASLGRVLGVMREFAGPPLDVAVLNGNIIVLDSEGSRLVVFNREKKKTPKTFHLSGTKSGKHLPLCIRAGKKNCLFVLFPTFVGKYTDDGTVKSKFGHGDLIDACSMALNSSDQIVVLDRGKGDLIVFESDGTKVMKFGGRLEKPMFVHVTSTDAILVSDHGDHSIKCYEKNGKFSFGFASQGSGDGQLTNPCGIATAKINNSEVILVADEGNDRISMFDKRGHFVSHLVNNEPRLQSPRSVTVANNMMIVTRRSCFQCPVFDLQ